jgi:hypothetical protein
MQVAVIAAFVGDYILALKVIELNVAARNHKVADDENAYGQDYGSVEIGAQHALVVDAAAEYGYYLGVPSHLRGEEQGGDENEQRSV